jgi:hypothetical protein
VIRRFVLASALCALAVPAFAQPRVDFFPSSRFFMDAEHLGTDSIQYKWRADFHGDVDLLTWPRGGRATFLANYEVVLGNEFQRFDPEQGNYTLEGSAMQRVMGVDVGVVFHHLSRHVSDRSKRSHVDWNMWGVRVRHDVTRGPLSVALQADVRDVVARSFVDYRNELQARADVAYQWRPRIGIIGSTRLRIVGVDDTYGRDAQTGFRAEGGVRLGGTGGAVELFLAGERRVDADVTALGPRNWVAAGFRLRSRE